MKELELYCPYEYKVLSKENKITICNGCGPQSKFDFIPDKIWGLKITEVCNIHDYMYYNGKNIEDKKEADRVFLNNLIRLIDYKTKWKWLKFLRRRRAYKYYNAVKYFGGSAFWSGKNNENRLIKRSEFFNKEI